MKIGLVLEGGGMRGMYTAGVLDVFMQNGIKVDGIMGVSAGALFGVNYLSEQVGRVIRYNKKFNRNRLYMGIIPYLREGGFVSTKFAYYDVPHNLDPFDDEKFKSSDVKFYAVVTNVSDGSPEYMEIHSVFEQMDTLRASGSVPIAFKPVKIGENRYLDGGVADSIPYKAMQNMGYDRLVVVLTRESGYIKQPLNKAIVKLHSIKYPEMTKVMVERHNMYNAEVAELNEWQSDGRAFIIRPSVEVKIKSMERSPKKLQRLYDLGIKDAESSLSALKNYLSKKSE